MLNDLLLALHLISLLMAAGAGFTSGVVMRRAAATAGEGAAALRGLGPTLARLSSIGLVVMWLSGLGMVGLRGGFGAMPALFWVKFVFITTLTLAAVAVEATYAQIKAGNAQAAARLPLLGPIAGASSLLTVIFAVLTFH